jgi:hypothetical protein
MRLTRAGADQTPSGDRPNRSLNADRVASVTSASSADIAQHLRGLLGGDVVDEHAHGRFTAGQVLELARCPTDREDLQEQVGQAVADRAGACCQPAM